MANRFGPQAWVDSYEQDLRVRDQYVAQRHRLSTYIAPRRLAKTLIRCSWCLVNALLARSVCQGLGLRGLRGLFLLRASSGALCRSAFGFRARAGNRCLAGTRLGRRSITVVG